MPTPLPAISRCKERIDALLNTRAMPTEFELRSLRRDIERTLSTDPKAGYMALGLVAAIEKNEAAVLESFRIAAQYGENMEYIANLAIALRRLEKVAESANAINSAVDADSTNPKLVRHAMRINMEAGNLKLAEACDCRLRTLVPDAEKGHAPMTHIINHLLQRLGVPEAEASTLFQLASTLLAERGLSRAGSQFFLDEDQGDESVMMALEVAGIDPETAVALETELADRMLDAWTDTRHYNRLMVCFTPAAA